jgi:hypothetical protein
MSIGREELENDPENTCFGCGPSNPKGLRLRFIREGDRIVCDVTFDKWFSNWPGQITDHVVDQALDCTTEWTCYVHTGQVAPFERVIVESTRTVVVGETVHLVGYVTKRSPDILTVRAEAHQNGELKAELESELRIVKDLDEFHRLRPQVDLSPLMKRQLP